MGNTCSDSETDPDTDSVARTMAEAEQIIRVIDPQGFHAKDSANNQNISLLQKTNGCRSVSLGQECIICYDDISVQEAYWLPCSHVFHDECIRRWFAWADRTSITWNTGKKIVRRCPICSHSIM